MDRAEHELWAKMAWAAVDVATRAGLDADGIYDALPFDAVSIRRLRRLAWTDYCVLIERIEARAGGPEACASLLEATFHDSFPELRVVASAFVSPKAFMQFAALVTQVLMPPVDFRAIDAGPDCVRIEARLLAGARPCATYFRGTAGTIAGLTRHIGLPRATVDADLSDHHGTYHVLLPPSRTLLSRVPRDARGMLRHAAARFVLGFEEDGSPVTTSIGEPPVPGLPERLAAAIDTWELTPRQSDVLGVLASGKSNKEIAGALSCAENTVELHVTQLLRRSGASSRGELIARFWSEL